MSEILKWKVPKWPFIIIGLLLMGFAFYFIFRAPLSIGHWAFAAISILSLSLGGIIAVIPFYLDYKAMGKALEINALGAVAEKIDNLEQFTTRISAATEQWALIQDSVGKNAETTAVSAKQIADKMGAEVKEFSEFMKRMNDSEKAGLRLETEKLRRNEAEWLQTLVRVLDHVFALHAAAVRSSQPRVAEQITQFQNACRGTIRRVGLSAFVAEPDEAFDPERHQIADAKQKPFDGAVIAETVGAGYTFQGKLVRPAMVRLGEPKPAVPPAAATAPRTEVMESAQDDLALDAD